MRQITKIRLLSTNEIIIFYNSHNGETKSETKPAMPEPDFIKALQYLNTYVARILEVDPDYIKGMRIIGVTLKHKKDALGFGCCITAQKSLENNNCPAILSTPYRAPIGTEGLKETKCVSESLNKKLNNIHMYAIKFLDGVREQGGLFETEKDEQVDIEEITKGT